MKEFSNFYLPTKYFVTVCRVCLSECKALIPIEQVNLTHNLNPNGSVENVNLQSVFKKFCNAEVKPSDNKPQNICEDCINMVCKAFNCFQLFLYSDALLDIKIQEHKLSQEKSNLDEDDHNNDYVSSQENFRSPDDFSFIKNENVINNASSHVDSTEVYDNIIVSDEEEVLKSSIDDLSSADVIDKNGKRKRAKRQYRRQPKRSVLQDRSLLEHDYCAADRVKQDAIDLLVKIGNKSLKQAVTKNPIGRPKARKKGRKNQIFKCRLCGKIICNITDVLKHLDEEHVDVMRCILCPTRFRRVECLRYHVAAHAPNGLVCRLCRLHFENKEALEEHNKVFDHSNIKKCPVCQKTFKSGFIVRHHMDSVHFKKANYQCRRCGKMFRHPGNMRRHERTSHGIKRPFLCQNCGKSYTTNYQFKRHMQIVHQENQGLVIKKYSVTKKYKYAGESRLSPRTKEVFECKFCPKKYLHSFAYLRHCEIHPEFNEYLCEKCNKLFETRKEYLDHRLTHKEVKCPRPDCDKMFFTKMEAIRHKYVHKYAYRCTECTSVFKSKQSLTSHMNGHTDARPYICEQCGQAFRQTSHLSCHMISQHGGQKPWQCKLCDKAFYYSSALKCHMRSHTGKKPFPCPFCNRMFRDVTGRHKHVKKDHPSRMMEFLIYKKDRQAEEIREVEAEAEAELEREKNHTETDNEDNEYNEDNEDNEDNEGNEYNEDNEDEEFNEDNEYDD